MAKLEVTLENAPCELNLEAVTGYVITQLKERFELWVERLSRDPLCFGDVEREELAAFHLYRLGAQNAQEVVFLADGAEWIWNRFPMVAHQAGISRWSAAVDFSHAVGYLFKAVNATHKDLKIRKKIRKRFRCDLRQGRILHTRNENWAHTNDIELEITFDLPCS